MRIASAALPSTERYPSNSDEVLLSRFRRPVTPAEIGSTLEALIAELVPGSRPVYVDVRPVDDAPANECFPLVDALVKRHGGELVTGWALWEFPTLFVEAELHGVWRMPTGDLVDPTPKQEPCERVLFLTDAARSYDGRQVDNVRRAIRPDPLLQTYLATFEAEFEVMNRGDRADQHGLIQLLDEEARELHDIQSERAELHLQMLSLFPVIGPYHPCPCGSGRKVRWCHRETTARPR